jgi:RNA polymerase sigma-70 factor (ECF subfamily)
MDINQKIKNVDEDFEIIKSVLAGRKNDFERLQKKYKRQIHNLISRMIKNDDDVDDLTQETFIKAYNALASFQFGYSFSAWLYRIASNNCIDFLRKKRFDTISINQPIFDSEEEHEYEIEDNSYVPDKNMLAEERKKVLYDAIEALPENYRMIIKLRHDDELDYNQIAEKLNLPLGTVKAHLFRARKILLNELKGSKNLFTEI